MPPDHKKQGMLPASKAQVLNVQEKPDAPVIKTRVVDTEAFVFSLLCSDPKTSRARTPRSTEGSQCLPLYDLDPLD